MACPLARTVQGIEWQLGVNHFGHFLLLQKIRLGHFDTVLFHQRDNIVVKVD